MTSNPPYAERIVFLDNLRYLFVLFVVVEHSANAYNGLGWWAVADPQQSLLARLMSAFSDVFAMPLLFYIAGYFALPNLQKKGRASFLRGKLKRLGIPWLVCVLTICPIVGLIYHYSRAGFSLGQSYASLWLEIMRNALEFNVGFITSINQMMQANQFSQRYMWFLSLLILFFVLFAMLHVLFGKWLDAAGKSWQLRPAALKTSLAFFLGLSLATTLLSFSTIGLMLAYVPHIKHPEPFFTLGNVIQFRPSRLFFYAVYFALGVVTYRNKWLERDWFPGRLSFWGPVFGFLFAAFLIVYLLFSGAPPELKRNVYGPLYFLVLNFLCAACLGLSLCLGIKYWNQPRSWDQSLAANSYNIYLSHYVFVITLQLMLLPVQFIPGTIKFVIVAVSGGLLAYVSSQWLIRPHPRLAVLAAFGLWAAMAILIRP